MERDASHIPFVDSGSYPVRAGNRVTPLVDGEPAFRRICEAVEAAKRSVWVTVAFMDTDFEMPEGRGNLFDVLDRAHAEGIDVRVIFWRHLEFAKIETGSHFAGTADERRMLKDRGTRFAMRWDQAHGRYCQHQKSWLVDAGTASETAFVGGINLGNDSVVSPGHAAREGENTHDVYVEVTGPAATDVHHNFAQRWNEASDRGEPDGCWPDASSQNELKFPSELSREAGAVPVQIQRTVRRDRYFNAQPAVDHRSHDIAGGEYSVADQYRQAIERARDTIYIEDQAIGSQEIVDRLDAALARGVDVVFLAPIDVNDQMAAARLLPESKPFFDSLGALARHDNFALCGIATNRAAGGYQNVYVHAKITLVDDGWCTIGSTNIGSRSFYCDTELNASFWHTETVRALRVALLAEHLGRDTSELTDRAALALYRDVARANRDRWLGGAPLEGSAIALDPATYAAA